MKNLTWSGTLSVEVKEVDDDHRRLVDLFNLLNHAINEGSDPSVDWGQSKNSEFLFH